MTEIADYDSSRYDYTKYWKGRQYEHKSEENVVTKLLPNKGSHILDVGGGFGRLTPLYQPKFEQATILDYSQNLLDEAEKLAQDRGWKNLNTVKGNLYEMPFADNSFDSIIMVRVLHHVENLEEAFTEIARVIKPNGVFILEFANKIHLKSSLKAILKGDFGFRADTNPTHHSTKTIDGKEGVFYNFHPSQVQDKLEKAGFKLEKKSSSSNLRLEILKKLLPDEVLLSTDASVEPIFSFLNLSPSMWLKLRKK